MAGTLRTVTLRPRGTSLTMEADLWDGTGSVTLVWLGRRDIPGIRPGRRITVHGRVAQVKDERTIYNPSYQLQPRCSADGPCRMRSGGGRCRIRRRRRSELPGLNR